QVLIQSLFCPTQNFLPPFFFLSISILRNRLTGLMPDILLDPIYIGLFGSTGAGKSTLLNAIIDKNFFLPVSGYKACTSCVVQVNTSHSKTYEAKIYLLTDEEWKDELKSLMPFMDPDEEENDSERNEAFLKISAIYGEKAENKSYEELCEMKPIIRIPDSRCIILKDKNEKDFSEKMSPYIWIQSIRSDTNAGTGEGDNRTRFWPLIKNVEVTIPRLQMVPESVVFVDIPGTGDFSSKRDAMWKENINKCSIIWVVNSIERIHGDKIHEKMLNEGMKAFQCGICRDISLVVTKSDQMNLKEYKRKKKKKKKSVNKHDAILERNEIVKQEKSKILKRNLAKKLPSDSEILHKDDLVYTVSAQEYWEGEMLSKEETEIPKLREYIQRFYIAQKRNKLMDYVEEASVIFSLIQSLRSNQNPQYQHAKEIHLKALIMKKIDELEADIEKCFLPIEQPLSEGVEQAKKLYKKSMDKILHDFRRWWDRLWCSGTELGQTNVLSSTLHSISPLSSLFPPIFSSSYPNRIQMGTRSTLKANFNIFRDAMLQQLQEDIMKDPVADIKDKLKFLQQETDFIIRETEKVVFQKKAEIYQSLTVSIQNNLLPYYEEAAKQRGAKLCKRIQTILSEGIKKESEEGMFERAQESMKKHFHDLK
ncbi:SLIP GTPase, partial [Chordeiles acutipennis]|nr:SLIP GTPase [Chordeiles acutipennis]